MRKLRRIAATILAVGAFFVMSAVPAAAGDDYNHGDCDCDHDHHNDHHNDHDDDGLLEILEIDIL